MTRELVKSALMGVALFGTSASAEATKTHRPASTGTVTLRAFAQNSDKPGIPGSSSRLQDREFHEYESTRMPPIAW